VILVIHCPGQKRFRAHSLPAVWGEIVSFFGGGGNPPKKKPGINTDLCLIVVCAVITLDAVGSDAGNLSFCTYVYFDGPEKFSIDFCTIWGMSSARCWENCLDFSGDPTDYWVYIPSRLVIFGFIYLCSSPIQFLLPCASKNSIRKNVLFSISQCPKCMYPKYCL